jgi:hypothetical protein
MAAKKKVAIAMDGAIKVVEVPEPLKRKCELKDVLPQGVIQLLASAPHNETVRNVLLAHLKVPVPEELKSYKDIQDWIEFNIEPPKALAAKGGVPIPASRAEVVAVAIALDDREHGTCSYSRDMWGRGTVNVTQHDIVTAAAESDDSDEFWGRVRDVIYEEGPTDHIEIEPVPNSASLSDCDVHDSDGLTVEIQTAGYQSVKDFLARVNPEAYERLFE